MQKSTYVQKVWDKIFYLSTHLRNSCQDVLRMHMYTHISTNMFRRNTKMKEENCQFHTF